MEKFLKRLWKGYYPFLNKTLVFEGSDSVFFSVWGKHTKDGLLFNHGIWYIMVGKENSIGTVDRRYIPDIEDRFYKGYVVTSLEALKLLRGMVR